mgnify:CR=1 FL=1
MTFILFFAVLFVLILVHEWGHFIVAKKTGMRVDEFGIGFPPKLFGHFPLKLADFNGCFSDRYCRLSSFGYG